MKVIKGKEKGKGGENIVFKAANLQSIEKGLGWKYCGLSHEQV